MVGFALFDQVGNYFAPRNGLWSIGFRAYKTMLGCRLGTLLNIPLQIQVVLDIYIYIYKNQNTIYIIV